jgi:predicted DsbA family dithiol-disulfide isomerase
MKFKAAIFCLITFFSFNIFAQNADEVLATANGRKFTAKDFPANVQNAYLNLPKTIAEKREQFLQQQIEEILMETEAKAKNLTIEKLFEKEIAAKVPNPKEEQIKAIYDANRPAIGDKTMEEVRPQIIRFLRQPSEQTAYANYIATLKNKYKVTLGKDVNAPDLKSLELLAKVGENSISVRDFDDKNKSNLYDFEADLYDNFFGEIKEVVFLELLSAEAKALKMEVSDFVAQEITNKMREFSDAEREGLENALAKRLFKKYNATFLLKEPVPFVHKIAIQDEPTQGKADASVTVVMFTDFQCPACAAVYPVLKKVVNEYGDKVRFVVRDFPLVNIHENAFNAAIAANAANAQGKFFIYKEILYQNQDKLDKESLKKYAAQIGLNVEQFTKDLESEKFADEVRADMADGKSYGITGTPTIFVNGVKVRALSAENFRNVIEKSLQ